MNTDKIYAESIANEYAKKETPKVISLKKLDRAVKAPALVFGYIFGTLSSLLLGTGMCLCMGQIGGGTQQSFIIGIAIGCVGIIGAIINYPIFKKIKKSRMQKYANDIVTLANEISNN